MSPAVMGDLRVAWRGLPMLLVAALPLLVAGGVAAVAAASGSWLVVAAAGGLGFGAGWQSCCDVAVRVRAGDVLGPRALAGAVGAGLGRGAVLGAGLAVPAILAVAALEATSMPAAVRLPALFCDLVLLGLALLGAPFAGAAQALGLAEGRGAWRAGLAIAGSAPQAVLAALTLLAVVPPVVMLLGPVPLWAAAGPLAVVAAGVAERVADGVREVRDARQR